MASSQDIDFVPFVRTPKTSSSSLTTGAGSGHGRKGSVPDKPRRLPPAPPPEGDFSMGDGTRNPGSTTRGRSVYRPATLSKPIIPIPAMPPAMNQVSGAKRRSRSAPPRGGGVLEAERVKETGTSLALIRSNSGRATVSSGTGRAVESPLAHSGSSGGDEGIDMESGSSGKGSPTPTANPNFVPWDPAVGKQKERLSPARGLGDSSEARVQVNPAFVPAPTIHTTKPQKSSFVTPSVPPAPTTAENEHEGDPERVGEASDAPVEDGLGANYIAARLKGAETHLTSKQKKQIEKEEAKSSKVLSKFIKNEGKADKVAISLAMNELEDLQRLHKQSVKLEAKALTSHSKTLSTYINALSHFEEIKQKFQGLESKVQVAAAQLEQADHALEEHKDRAREAMERVKEKREEVENMRRQFGVEQRERAVHLGELNGEGEGLEARQKVAHRRSRFGGIMK
ncbi:hypothetical protein H1R20_g15467, partial [Candolleomyces eurysporus]